MENNIKPPAGFEPVTVSGNFWVVKEPDQVVHGVLLARQTRKKGTGAYYSIRLESPCKVVTGSGESREVVMAPPETVVNLDENAAIAGMKDLLSSDLQYSVWLRFLSKKTLPSGNQFWDIEFYKSALPPSDDNVPF